MEIKLNPMSQSAGWGVVGVGASEIGLHTIHSLKAKQ